MSEKPEALRLADAMWAGRLGYGIAGEIAAELRRLHAENERLREALVRYGKHGSDCDAYRGCKCGLDDALRREET